MGKYEAELARLGESPLLKLEGPGGILAVTERELVFLDEGGVRRIALAQIRRVARGEGGVVRVQGEEAFLDIPLKAFPVEELKGFLEGLKPHVARARKATQAPPPKPPEPPKPVWEEEPPPAPKAPSVELAPEPEAPPPQPVQSPPPPTREGRAPLALPLRLVALLSLAYAVAFLALNPGADPWAQIGAALGGLGLALTAWSASTSSR